MDSNLDITKPEDMFMDNKNEKTLADFTEYCLDHPQQRFWQALRNWSNYDFIYGSNKPDNMSEVMSDEYLEDTYYKE